MSLSREEIILMARENGLWVSTDEWVSVVERVVKAAYAAGAAAEREACASICDGWSHADGDVCAAALRARGDK